MTPRYFRLWCVAGLFGATLLSAQTYSEQPAPTAPAGPERPAPLANQITTLNDEPITINLPSAPLDTALGLVETWTGRTILRPAGLPPVDGINLVIKRPLPPSEALLALETVLSLNQIALIPVGEKFIKVVPLGMARMEAPPLLEGSALDLPPSGRIMTKIFQLQFMRVDEFNQVASAQILNMSTGAVVMAMKANAVMVTDTVTNLQRLEALINKFDQPLLAGLMPKFYPLREAKASDVVGKLQGILQGSQQLGATTRYSADDRTNQVILVSDPRQYPIFDELISKLDVKSDPNTRNEVIALKHAASKEVSALLNGLISNQTTKTQGTRPGQMPRPPGQPAPGGPEPAPAVAAAQGGEGGSNEFSGLINIQSDERTNSVVVSGTVGDIRLIRDLINKLDTQLPQVRIEVVIAEVSLSDSDVSGLDSLKLTFGEHGNVTRILNFEGAVAGLAFASGTANPLSFVTQLTNNGEKRNVKVLSTPMIMTTHAKEGNILVGQSIPYAGSSQSTPVAAGTQTNGGAVTPGFSNLAQTQFKDILIDLKVTPLIGEDGSIQLKVDQKVDDLLGTSNLSGLGEVPIVGKRQAISHVNVHDGHMVVLGGLQRTRDAKGRVKLGFFWELPGISQLFGKRNRTNERTELLLFIRPTIVSSQKSTADVTKSIEQLSNKKDINEYLNTQQSQPPAPVPAPPPPSSNSKSGSNRAAEISRRK